MRRIKFEKSHFPLFLPRETFIWLIFFLYFQKNGDAHLAFCRIKFSHGFSIICFHLFPVCFCQRTGFHCMRFSTRNKENSTELALITKLSLTCFTRLYIHVNFSISFRDRQKSNISFFISKNKWIEISQELRKRN